MLKLTTSSTTLHMYIQINKQVVKNKKIKDSIWKKQSQQKQPKRLKTSKKSIQECIWNKG